MNNNYLIIKKIIDIIISLISMIILSPLFIIISIFIKTQSEGPIFFKQARVGKNKTTFKIFKFRTMRIDTPKDTPTHLLKNPEQYITKIGKFLRKTSLDELPQLINILIGQMSIVGPRPCLWNQEDLIEEREKYGANNVTPGLTGLAQVSGRDELDILIKAKFDGEYTNNISFTMDVKIFFKTIINVFKHDGIVEGSKKE